MREKRTLLVLDGVEPLQFPPGPQEGILKDPSLATLLRDLAAQNPGLCVVKPGRLHLEKARALIAATGYHRRDPDLASLDLLFE